MFSLRRFGSFSFFFLFIGVFAVLFQTTIWAAVVGTVRGVVHDPEHRPVQGAEVVVKASSSNYVQKLATDSYGSFEGTARPVGAYPVTVRNDRFSPPSHYTLTPSA